MYGKISSLTKYHDRKKFHEGIDFKGKKQAINLKDFLNIDDFLACFDRRKKPFRFGKAKLPEYHHPGNKIRTEGNE